MKRPSPSGKTLRPKPLVDFSKFKTDLSASDIAKLAGADAAIKAWPIQPIEVLSPGKTAGRGLTYLTFSNVVIFHAGGVPEVRFIPSNLPRRAMVGVAFEPGAYGITSVATYVITFNINVLGNGTFTVGGDGDIPNSGDYELSGRRTVQVILRNNPSPSQFAYLQNKEPGVDWFWYSSVIKVPDPIVNPPL